MPFNDFSDKTTVIQYHPSVSAHLVNGVSFFCNRDPCKSDGPNEDSDCPCKELGQETQTLLL